MPGSSEQGWFVPESTNQVEQPQPLSEVQQRILALRERAISGAREGFVNSVESGRAEQVGHRAIDIAAKTAEQSLNALPPGTRIVGKFVGRRVIGRLQDGAHDRIGATLQQTADRLDAPALVDYAALAPQPEASAGWGTPPEQSPAQPTAPGSEVAPIWGTGSEAPVPGWGGTSEASPAAGATPTEVPSVGWGTPAEVQSSGRADTPRIEWGAPPEAQSSWWTEPTATPVAEIPEPKKKGLFRRRNSEPTQSSPPTQEMSPWGPPPTSSESWWQ